MLHQKELVLNSTDTSHILAAVEAVRNMVIDLRTGDFSNILTSLGQKVGASVGNLNQDNIEQRVEITANFPNANNAIEIEKAILGLADTTYQYAYNQNMPVGKII